MKFTQDIRDEAELFETLKSLSIKHGGAWVFSIKPFSHETTFEQFASPCKVPDQFHDLTSNKMAHKGKIRGFTKAARRREQNRGLGRN